MTLKLGVPSKGHLMEQSFDWFAERGIELVRCGSAREYRGTVSNLSGVDLVFLSASEVPGELSRGRIHLGVAGTDIVEEGMLNPYENVEPLHMMGFDHSQVVVAVPQAWVDVRSLNDLDAVAAEFRKGKGAHLRIATKYPRLTRRAMHTGGVADYVLTESEGDTEVAIWNGSANLVVESVKSDESLQANHLKVLSDGIILRSQATLWRSCNADWSASAQRTLFALTERLLRPHCSAKEAFAGTTPAHRRAAVESLSQARSSRGRNGSATTQAIK